MRDIEWRVESIFYNGVAMCVTVAAAWLVGSRSERKRNKAFWLFILSNALWIVWGLHDRAYALIVLQLCLAGTNVRGALKNDPATSANRQEGMAK